MLEARLKLEPRLKAAAGGAADPPSPSTSSADGAGRRRRHRASSPTGLQEGATKRHPWRTSRSRYPLHAGRSRHTPVINERAAVHSDGAEAVLV